MREIATQSAPADTAGVRTCPPDVAAAVLGQFRVVFRSIRRHFQAIERKCGIGGSQLWALASVAAAPGLRVTELARRMMIHQSTASNLIEQLVRLGLIERRRDPDDQRVVRLHATEKGEDLLRRAPQPLTGLLPDALSHLDAETIGQLHDSLERLLAVMQRRDESGAHVPLADA